MVKPGWLKIPLLWWWRSLPLRVVLTVFLASVLVLVLGGFLLMQQATLAVVDSKTKAAQDVARQVVNDAQRQLNAADPTGEPDMERRLVELATQFANQGGGNDQFEVIIRARGQTITAGDVTVASIPSELASTVEQSNDLWMTPTRLIRNGGVDGGPRLAAGSSLTSPTADPY